MARCEQMVTARCERHHGVGIRTPVVGAIGSALSHVCVWLGFGWPQRVLVLLSIGKHLKTLMLLQHSEPNAVAKSPAKFCGGSFRLRGFLRGIDQNARGGNVQHMVRCMQGYRHL